MSESEEKGVTILDAVRRAKEVSIQFAELSTGTYLKKFPLLFGHGGVFVSGIICMWY